MSENLTLIPADVVRQRLGGISKTSFALLRARQEAFPAPVKLGRRANFWSSQEVDQFIARALETRGGE